ncbi:MAG TPA: metallophosphoesterase [Candidatus Hydrogenedentes bacterium]|nr:metallophosphoesterase [Candidatus Hydrogenedentota bacterium]HOK89584.1 metallophosphoesterase [Candidatus Hydrogenedentota bacterium]HPO30445.1 metallophosphoesterase [Candidatus Hydrogenedentota bacterium]
MSSSGIQIAEAAPLSLRRRAGETGARRERLEAKVWRIGGRHERQALSLWRAAEVTAYRIVLLAAGCWGRGWRAAHCPVLREITVLVRGLPPALDGFTILHLSDPHFGRTYPEHARATIRLLEGVSADLCVITGDFRHGHYGPDDHVPILVRELLDRARVRHGCWGVLGNHDTLSLGDRLETETGIRILYNEGALVTTGTGVRLWIAGVDDPHWFRLDDPARAMRDAPADAVRIMLAHSPEAAHASACLGVHLYLCGHTHGGQICLPGSVPIMKNARCPRALLKGLWRLDAMTGYTTTGLGFTDLPQRFWCPPEAVVLRLHPEVSSKATG